MLKAKILINLPSAETERRMGPIEWVKSLFGAEINLASGKEELTVSTITLIDGIVEGFRKAGITNVICFLADKKVIYNDVNNVDNDLHLIHEAAIRTGLMDRPFREIHLALDYHESGIHSIIDLKIRNEVILEDDELAMEVSGRIESLRVAKGESAKEYAERVKDFVKDENNLNAFRLAFQEQVQRITDSLQSKLIGSRTRIEGVHMELVQPGTRQIARFADLKFGKEAETTNYRSVPTRQRSGAYADPYYYYYHDPYYDFTTYLLLGSMFHGHSWNRPDVYVVDSTGNTLFSGSEASLHANENWGADSVDYSSSGGLVVSDSIVDQANLGASDDWGAAHSDSTNGGWGSSDFGSSDSGSSDSGSSCSSSSCGSSCGGSSCSSCGGSD